MRLDDPFQAAPLDAPVAALAIQREHFGETHADIGFDLAVEFDERHVEPRG